MTPTPTTPQGAEPREDGWVEWTGGENPVPGQAVDIKWGDGLITREPAHFDFQTDPSDGVGWQIIAYRVVSPAPAAPTNGGGGDTAFKVASDLHAAYEKLIYGLPKYLEAENLTDEENMIREAYVTLDVTAHRLAALKTEKA